MAPLNQTLLSFFLPSGLSQIAGRDTLNGFGCLRVARDLDALVATFGDVSFLLAMFLPSIG